MKISPRHRSTSSRTAARVFRLSWPVHRDLARILGDWPQYFKAIGSEAFALLILLEGLRIKVKSDQPARFHYAEFADRMDVSLVTLRRWLRVLKRAGLIHTEFVPHTNNTEAFFQIKLNEPPRSTSGRSSRRRHTKADQKRSTTKQAAGSGEREDQ